MSTHTPGPWCIFPDVGTTINKQGWASAPFLIPVGASVYEPMIASVHGNETQARANARLIAAAPDLLAALELALATIERIHPSSPFDSTQGTRDVANAAIAKAKGVTP